MARESGPLRYEFEKSKRRALVVYEEQPTFVDWSDTVERIFSDPERPPEMDLLFDRRMILPAADSRYVKQLVDFIDRKNAAHPGTRWAFVVEGLASFGMGRMAEQLVLHRGSMRVFRSMAEAEEWLDVPKANGGGSDF